MSGTERTQHRRTDARQTHTRQAKTERTQSEPGKTEQTKNKRTKNKQTKSKRPEIEPGESRPTENRMGERFTDAWQTAADIRAGKLTARDALMAALERIEQQDGVINAFTVVLAEQAAAAADRVDADHAAGRPLGPLAGVPVSVKDHIWMAGVQAANGSRALADFVPDVDAAPVARLRAAGAVIVGKTNNPEFCYRGITENELFGLTRNPRDLTRTPGGSSGGAAASVAAGMVPLALGTDGGGSIRIPSAFCGVYGLKPTFGLVPKLPGFRGWPTLSVTGPIAASVRDLALAASVLAEPSPEDDLSFPSPSTPADYLAAVARSSFDGLRIAYSPDLGLADIDADVRTAFERAIELIGAHCGVPGAAHASAQPVTPHPAPAQLVAAHPAPADLSAMWDAVALPEGLASEGPLLASGHVGQDAAEIIRSGERFTAVDYLNAQHARTALVADWTGFFERYDVLLTPAMPVTAFETGLIGPLSLNGRPVATDAFDTWCQLALPANLTGFPAISIPCGTGAGGLPVGLQLIGPRFSEPTLLRAAAAADAVLRSATAGADPHR